MTQQLTFNFERLPEPKPLPEDPFDITAWILEEHQKAELQRLTDGWAGCGCADCQRLYKETDIARYGSRVVYSGDIVIIKEKPGGGGNFTESNGEVISYVDGTAYGILPNGKTIHMGPEAAVKAVIADPELSYDIPAFDEIIELERKLTAKGDQDGDTRYTVKASRGQRPVKAGSKRARPADHTKHRIRHSRPAKTGQRLSGSLPRPAK
ncbi:hypothetical protein ACFLW5_02390 [Chloroflexota bacterium]